MIMTQEEAETQAEEPYRFTDRTLTQRLSLGKSPFSVAEVPMVVTVPSPLTDPLYETS